MPSRIRGAQMNLALVEMRQVKLRFGLLAGAVSLLVFLVLLLTTFVERSGQFDHWRSEGRGRGGAGLLRYRARQPAGLPPAARRRRSGRARSTGVTAAGRSPC